MTLALLLVLMVLAAHRAWRFVALDDLPPAVWLRERFTDAVADRFGTDWADGVGCQWCSGWWVSVIVVAVVWHYVALPLPGLWFLAVASGVGFVGRWLED